MDKLQFNEKFDLIHKDLRLKVVRDHVYKLCKKVSKKMTITDLEKTIRMIIYIVQKTEYDDFDDCEPDFKLEFDILKAINFNIFCRRDSKIIKISTNSNNYKKELFNDNTYGKFSVTTPGADDSSIIKWYINPYCKDVCIPGEFLKEVSILKCLDHPNIVKIKEVIVTKNIVGIVMEKLCVTLYDMLIADKEVPNFKKDIKKCMKYIHSKNIYHCDMHEGNLMFDNNCIPKLIDFNMAIVCEERQPVYEIDDMKKLKKMCEW